MARGIGFDQTACEEIAIVVSELASNIIWYAGEGEVTLEPVDNGEQSGIQVEARDAGPGIPDVDQALVDGFSTRGGLGYGLGTVHRMMDELEITSQQGGAQGTRATCRRWLRTIDHRTSPSPLDFGVATRAHPLMDINGDAFILRQWDHSALAGVIDGLGHGRLAHDAAHAARDYIESHYDLPLAGIFRGVGIACRSTRGVVMALARFEWAQGKMSFASVGNITARVLGYSSPVDFAVRRGVLGLNAPNPVITEHPWGSANVMILHTDGIKSRWGWRDFAGRMDLPAEDLAQLLLQTLDKGQDDATIIVVKGSK